MPRVGAPTVRNVPAEFRHVCDAQAQAANRADWDREADAYQSEHGDFLGDSSFVWCPEGVDERTACLLGDVDGQRVLDLGCGAAQCARWLRSQGAQAIGLDLSMRQLQHARRIDDALSGFVPVACGSATRLPFSDEAFDMACSAFGALPFLVDAAAALSEVARVVRPGGGFVFSVVHPTRRMFPDDPTDAGLTVTRSYFDRRAYVELDAELSPSYVEPHHTLGDWVDAISGSGLVLLRVVEPEWPADLTRVWGGWGPVRGAVMPGTIIFVTRVT